MKTYVKPISRNVKNVNEFQANINDVYHQVFDSLDAPEMLPSGSHFFD